MIFLTATSETLTLDTAAALSLDWSAGYVDIDSTTGATPGSEQGSVASVTTTTVVAAPAASVQRQLKSFIAVNKHAALTQTVTLNKVTGAGTFALARNVALAPNETLLWVDSIGFQVLDAFGVHKVANTLVNLGTGVTGTLPAQYGGTGIAAYTVGDILYASGTTALSKLAGVATGNVLLSGGVATAPAWGKVDLTAHVSGVLPVANGGTGLASGTSGGILGYTASGTLASSGVLTANALVLGGGAGATPSVLGSLGTTSTVLHGNVAGAPSFSAVSLTADVSGILPGANGGSGNGFFAVSGPAASLKTFTFPNASATVLTDNAAVTVAQGGTGLASYAVGDILYASAATALSKLADVATGNALISGGVTTAPSWGKIGLTTHVTGTLPEANGGTGFTAFGTGVATWLQTPSSANLRTAVTDETGTGALVFADTPTLVTPAIGAATGTSVVLSSSATATAFIPTGSTIPANGMYLSGANTLDFATASANRLKIDSSGRSGFGRTPAGEILETSRAISIHGSLQSATGPKFALDYSTNVSRLLAFGSGTGTTGAFSFYQASSDNSVSRTAMEIDTSGNPIFLMTATPPTLATNSQVTFNLTSNTNFRISARGSDGTTRVGNITLA